MNPFKIIKTLFQGNKPQYMSEGAAGADLQASEDVKIRPLCIGVVKTGTSVELPIGTFGMAVPRSSICKKMGLFLINSVGIIDSDYRGEIMLMYFNLSLRSCFIKKGERIGQLVCVPFVKLKYIEGDLEDTERGSGGFGSTGSY